MSGFDPEFLVDGITLMGFHMEAGKRDFIGLAQLLARELEVPVEKLRPYLRGWYEGARFTLLDMGVDLPGCSTEEEIAEAMVTMAEWADAPVDLPHGMTSEPIPASPVAPTEAELRALMGQALSAPTPEAILHFTDFATRMKGFGPFNVQMIFAQRPGAGRVASRLEWEQQGRTVRRGAIARLRGSFDCSISTRKASFCLAKFTLPQSRTRPGSVGAYRMMAFSLKISAGCHERDGGGGSFSRLNELEKDLDMAKVSSPIPPALRERIKAMAADVAGLVPSTAYVNYMIIDPTQPDPDGILPGMPIYVGQSGDIAKRIHSHMHCALTKPVRRGSLYHRIAELVRADAVPIFRILQVFPTRLDSMAGETNWAQRLLRSGAVLLNRWPEQKRLMPARELARRQRRRLFDLSIAAAEEAGAVLQARCCRDGWHVAIGPEHLLPRFGEVATFHAVRRVLRECPECGGRLRHSIVIEADQAAIERRAG